MLSQSFIHVLSFCFFTYIFIFSYPVCFSPNIFGQYLKTQLEFDKNVLQYKIVRVVGVILRPEEGVKDYWVPGGLMIAGTKQMMCWTDSRFH